MRVGDIITIINGRFSLTSVLGTLRHVTGVDNPHCRYRVLDMGRVFVSADDTGGRSYVHNDMMVVDVVDCSRVIFTRKVCCRMGRR